MSKSLPEEVLRSWFPTPKMLRLSSDGLKCVNWDRCDEDFEFVFRGGKVCRVHSHLAEFLSKKIAQIRKCDPFCNCYAFSGETSEGFTVFESFVSSLLVGRPIEVNATNWLVILEIFSELQNSEICDTVLGWICENCGELGRKLIWLRLAYLVGGVDRKEFEEIREFVASNLCEINQSLLDDLDLEVLEYLLSSPSLKIVDEDWLYRFVKSQAEKDERCMILFEYVWFEYLSVENVQDFVSFISGRFREVMSPSLWERICCRLVQETKTNTGSSRVRNQTKSQKRLPEDQSIVVLDDDFYIDIDTDSDGDDIVVDFDEDVIVHSYGIMECLSARGGISGNVSLTGCGGSPICAFEKSKSVYQSSLCVQPYLCCDFRHRRVLPTGYFLDSRHPLSTGVKWMAFEGSNNGQDWVQLDRREFLLGADVGHRFTLTNPTRDSFRYLRLRGLDARKAQFIIRSFEIYGQLDH